MRKNFVLEHFLLCKLLKQPFNQKFLQLLAVKIYKCNRLLVFAGVFLGGVLKGGIPQLILIIAGFAVAVTCCIFGLLLISEEKKRGEILLKQE